MEVEQSGDVSALVFMPSNLEKQSKLERSMGFNFLV
jgi:hypothetical protein